jgi:hypothetical protein
MPQREIDPPCLNTEIRFLGSVQFHTFVTADDNNGTKFAEESTMGERRISENATLTVAGRTTPIDAIFRVTVTRWDGARSTATSAAAGISSLGRNMVMVRVNESMGLGEPMELVTSFR